MTIDCELYGYEVLISDGWDQFRPKVVIVESDAYFQPKYQVEGLCCSFLELKGYKL